MSLDAAPGSIRLTDYLFTTADLGRLSGASEVTLRNWIARGVLPPIGQRFAGRLMFTLADALRVAAVNDLTTRVVMPPATAVKVAELVVRQVSERSPGSVVDVNAMPATLALAVAWQDGEPHVQLVDQGEPGGYLAWQGEWGRAHVVLPLSGLLAGVIWTAIDVLAERQGGVA
jgi:hypothetical protein